MDGRGVSKRRPIVRLGGSGCLEPTVHERLGAASIQQVALTGAHALELKTPWSDGTTHLSLEPTELLERLAALVPRPQKNLLIYPRRPGRQR